jgi:hypothetical protein
LFRTTWLTKLAARWGLSHTRPRPARRRPALGVEPLEDRTVPAAVTLSPASVLDEDVIVNCANGVPDTTQSSLGRSEWAFMTQSYADFLGGQAGPGMPDDGFVPATAVHPALQLPYTNAYYGNNARVIRTDTASLSFAVPAAYYRFVHVAGVSTEGDSGLRLTLHYTTGDPVTTDVVTVPDWISIFEPTADRYSLLSGLERARPDGAGGFDANNRFGVFGFRFAADPNRVLAGVTVEKTSTNPTTPTFLVFFGAYGELVSPVPTVGADRPVVSVDEGQTATNTGTINGGNGTVTLSASAGTVVDNGDGSWRWSLATTDGPGQSQTVTVTITDAQGTTGSTTFRLTVNNVAPTAVLTGGTVPQGSSSSMVFTNPFDPSPADGDFRYSFDLDNDGTFDVGDGTYAGSGAEASATVPADYLAGAPGPRLVRGRILDKDGGFTDHTATITVVAAAPTVGADHASVIVGEGGLAINTGTWADANPAAVTLSASVGTVTRYADGTWAWTFATTDGPAQGQAVTITAADGSGVATVTFDLVVTNVAPTAVLSNSGPVTYGNAVTVGFGGQSDPSPADTAAGFTYAYSLDGVNFTPSTNSSASFTLGAGAYSVYGRIIDKDGSYTQYSTEVTVGKATPVVMVAGVSATYDGAAHPTTGTVTGVGGVSLGAASISYSGGSAPVNAGTYTATGSFAGDANYNPATGTTTIVIARAQAVVSGTGGTFVYDGAAHPATGSVTGVGGVDLGTPTFTYNGGTAAPVGAGTYTVVASYAGSANYEPGSATATIVIARAPSTTTVTGGTLVYDGAGHGATAAAVTGAGGLSALPTLAYTDAAGNPVVGLPTHAGSYTVQATYPGDANHTGSAATATITITRANPTVSVIGGTFVYDGAAHPATGSVTGVGGVDLGTPTFTYNGGTAAPVNVGSYTVVASFAGNADYNPASATATITIIYGARTLTDLSSPFNAGSTIPIKIQLRDAAGNNLSSPNIRLTAVRLERVNPDGTRTQVTLQEASANPGNLFRYEAGLGGYIFNLSTKGLAAGTYEFTWTAEGDQTVHTLQFRIT